MEIINPNELEKFKNTVGNKIWRIQNLYKVRDKNRNLTKLKLNDVQMRIIDRVKDMTPIRSFDLKARQLGVSTLWLLWWLDDTIFKQNTISGVLADKRENLGYLFEIVRLAHSEMPSALRPRLGDNSKSVLSFPDINSKIFVSLSIKSTALHNLHISEICYCKDTEIQRTLGACGPKANITMESTGNGIGNYGYETYQDSKTGSSSFRCGFLPWFIHADYRLPLNGQEEDSILKRISTDEKRLLTLAQSDYGVSIDAGQILFRRWKQKDLKGLYRQEYPETDEDAFLTSGSKFFEYRKLNRLLLEIKEYFKENDPVEQTDDYVMWEKPNPKNVYVAGADTAEGSGDPSVLKIINVTQKCEVFRYRARVNYKTFYKICDKWGRFYNRCLLGVERNNHGHAVLLGLEEDCHYPNLYKEESQTRLKNNIAAKSGKSLSALPEHKTGWQTSQSSRPLMLDMLKGAIEGDETDDVDHFFPEILFYDDQLLTECLTFEEIKGKFQAVPGKTDDNIIGSAIAYQMYLRKAGYIGDMKKSNAEIISVKKREYDE